MRKVDPISKDDAWDNFVSAINNQKTLENYVRALNEFIVFHNLRSYSEFVNLPVPQIQNFLKEWITHLKSKNLKGNSISTKINPIELMLEMNEIVWAKRKIKKMIPKSVHEKGGKRPITTEEIQLLLKTTNDFRMIAIIHFLSSTGVRPAVLTDPPLQFKHLKNLSDGCYTVKIYDESSEGYWVFLTPEASRSLDAYIRTRKLNGEHLDETSYLFVTKQNARTRKNDYLSQQSVSKALTKLYTKAGIIREKKGNRFDLAVTYGFRKRFNTILKLNNAVNSNVAEKLMAHKRGLDGTYLQPTREECFVEFLKAVSDLTIDSSERKQVELEKIKKEKSELEQEKENHELIQEQMNKMQQELEDLKYGPAGRRNKYNQSRLDASDTLEAKINTLGIPLLLELLFSEEKKRDMMKEFEKAELENRKPNLHKIFGSKEMAEEQMQFLKKFLNEKSKRTNPSESTNYVKPRLRIENLESIFADYD